MSQMFLLAIYHKHEFIAPSTGHFNPYNQLAAEELTPRCCQHFLRQISHGQNLQALEPQVIFNWALNAKPYT